RVSVQVQWGQPNRRVRRVEQGLQRSIGVAKAWENRRLRTIDSERRIWPVTAVIASDKIHRGTCPGSLVQLPKSHRFVSQNPAIESGTRRWDDSQSGRRTGCCAQTVGNQAGITTRV